jgi:hypothetical protein
METTATRACLGFSAGAIAVLTFHQGLSELFFHVGLPTHGGYRTAASWPFGLPAIVNLCFSGGIYGAIFAVFFRQMPRSMWRQGLVLGLLSAVISLLLIVPLKGHGIAFNGALWPIARSLLLNSFWGLGVGLLLPMLRPKRLTTAHAVPDAAVVRA